MIKIIKRFGIILLLLLIFLGLFVILFIQHPMFGASPSGEKLKKIEQSVNYHDGQFWNISKTQISTPNESGEKKSSIFSRFKSNKQLYPQQEILSIKTNLKELGKDNNVVVRLGHSAYFMIIDGKTYLVDPTLITASPVRFINKPFKGSNVYTPNDIPDIDYLIITHDHYDHLDYYTMKEIKEKVGKVILPLGVGAHFERWGYKNEKIIELDRYDELKLENDLKITSLPARHYAGRLFKGNNTLWSAFMLETDSKTVFIGGDGGYDSFFKDFGEKWENIDLAMIENGQYDEQWKYIHLLPEDVIKVIKDLNPQKVITVHNSKYAMANHSWNEPMKLLDEKIQKENINSWLTPKIGEIVYLDEENQIFSKWWDTGENENIKNELNSSAKQNSDNKSDLFINDLQMDNSIQLKIGDQSLKITLEDNISTKALIQKLKEGDILINIHEYGGFEKVGDLGFELPSNDKNITTKIGDIVLYQGNQISLFYGTNTWSYTKLGHIENISDRELKKILGDGDEKIVLSLGKKGINNYNFDYNQKTVLLNSNYTMPLNGIGTYSLQGDICIDSVKFALQNGYRLIDTAYMYGNEREIGQAIRESGVPREEIFITTKLYPNQFEEPEKAIEDALDKLGVDYIDLMLLHHPGTNDIKAYNAMEKYVRQGKIKSIGLSNRYIKELEEILPQISIKPALVQNEIHPYYQESEVIDYIHNLGITVEGWYSLGGRGHQTELLSDPTLVEIAKKYNKSVAQIILRWNLQNGVVVIPGSSNESHILENQTIYDFVLDEDDMLKIKSLNRNEKHDWY